jgi:predicted aldo/keto reductase-like oxidoreductase
MAIDFGKRFGLGGLRLPILNDDQMDIDYETLNKMIDKFMAHGFNYYDTSYIYHGQLSETALGKSLVARYPRDSFLLSTKMPIKFMTKKEDMEQIFEEQLQKCQVDYFDFYLIHSIGKEAYDRCKEWGTFEFLLRKQEEGKFREFGVSLHDSPEFLDMILTEHPEISFVVEQLNYIDWVNPAIRSKEIYEVAVKHGKPVVVMEACKGGTLAEIPDEAKKVMKDYNPDASIASWAFRFVGSLPGVRVVLAGMPRMEFLDDNIKTFENFVPLNEEEYGIVDKVVEIINSNTAIACTYCRYCVDDCPKKIAIPDYFALYNDWRRLQKSSSENEVMTQAFYYMNWIEQGNGPASVCIKCKKCEKVCPQHLPIIQYLEEFVVGEIESYNPEAHIQQDKQIEI